MQKKNIHYRTVNPGRVGNLRNQTRKTEANKMGEILSYFSGEVLRWKDKKEVLILLTCHN
jgi:hypothetical protein